MGHNKLELSLLGFTEDDPRLREEKIRGSYRVRHKKTCVEVRSFANSGSNHSSSRSDLIASREFVLPETIEAAEARSNRRPLGWFSPKVGRLAICLSLDTAP